MDLLAEFYTARQWLGEARFDEARRTVTGSAAIDAAKIPLLQRLDQEGHVKIRINGQIENAALLRISPTDSVDAELTLTPFGLQFFEGMDDLLSRTISTGEPDRYFIYPFGEILVGQSASSPQLTWYREMLRVKTVLRSIADLDSAATAVFLAPQPLAVPFICRASALRSLPQLSDLEAGFEKGAVERDQRTALFKRSLREYLFNIDEEDRFAKFLEHFPLIYDTYRRDFLLWIGQAFSELEKTFEEKRLKFIVELNSILASVQASILAVPLAVLLVGDKYNLADPFKNFLLALTVLIVAIVADRLLSNQRQTLISVSRAIDALKIDFDNKQPQRKPEFQSRLSTLRDQEKRVSNLLRILRVLLWLIFGVVAFGWAASFVRYELTGVPGEKPTQSPGASPKPTQVEKKTTPALQQKLNPTGGKS